MNSGGTSVEYILIHPEVNRFLFIVMLFLCVGGVLIRVFCYVFTELLHYSVTALQVGTLATGWTRGSRSLELEMDGRATSCVWNLGGVTASGDIRLCVFRRERLLVKRLSLFVQHRYRWQTASLGEPADGSSVDGETATSTLTSQAWQQHVSTRCRAFAGGVSLLGNGCALVRCTHGLKTRKRRPGVVRPLEGASTESALHHVRALRGWSLKIAFLCSLSLVAVRRFVSPHIEEACERSSV